MRNAERIRKWKTAAVAAALLGATVANVGGASAAEESRGPAKNAPALRTVVPTAGPAAEAPGVIAVSSAASGLLHEPVHQRHYWKLLAAAYAPDLTDEWDAALAERKAAEERLSKRKPLTVHIPSGGADAIVEEELGELKGEIESRGEPFRITFRKSGEAIALERGAETRTFVFPAPPEGVKAAETGEPDPAAQRLADLAAAVEAEDAEAITALLPQLLDDYRKQTEALLRMAEQLGSETEAEAGA
ncbi:hypothetical protein [Paenibacillus sp.]|uniref:hypothetical protein n=1 Tax=Paenibacillus sp. TaxID=58172 RepID=UPI002D339BE7|nr:hypothetical protein [Paenibacillus sp.]HZG86675.1 hypothetical protein [Paenibacillus sp.]